MKRILAALLLLTLVAPAWGQDFEMRYQVYEHSEYETSLREFRPLAEQGHAFAQALLGGMYRDGFGVQQGDAEAVKWYRKAAGQPTICTDKDREYSSRTGRGGADEAYKFGLRIQESVERRDIHSLFGLVIGELGHGPRKKSVWGKSFSEIFTDEWREVVLSEEPACTPMGWRGFMLGNGSIWYQKDSDVWSIHSINGVLESSSLNPADVSWRYNGEFLTSKCFTTEWMSSDNYEEYYEKYGNGIDWRMFVKNIGQHIGGRVPIESIVTSWGDKISLTRELFDCLANKETPDTRESDGRVETRVCNPDTDVSRNCHTVGYRVLRQISDRHCRLLAPNFTRNCIDLRLVEIFGNSGGTMEKVDVGIYGIIEDPTTKEVLVMPLVNFDNANNALNYVDDLD